MLLFTALIKHKLNRMAPIILFLNVSRIEVFHSPFLKQSQQKLTSKATPRDTYNLQPYQGPFNFATTPSRAWWAI